MTDPWNHYAEALRALADAPNMTAGQRRAITDTRTKRIQNADKLLRASIEKRERLDQRLRELAALARSADSQVVGDRSTPPPTITLPEPKTIAEVVQICDLLTEHLRHATKCLAEARRRKERRQIVVPAPVAPAPVEPPPVPQVPQRSELPWPLVAAGVIAAVLLLTLLVLLAL
ncbi:hypothetical protein ACFVMC_28505 [Nocardia sp. NPDC127579]|uniref:hypothetical protein n=1 Tax=Nocardia sp. NPDC127579 TaxID=3345402 RepID=UPI00362F7D48